MKLIVEGDHSKAICSHCAALVSTSFKRRDVPFSDGKGIVKDILVGVCDRCDRIVSTPAQSTPAIKAAREKALIPVEAQLPAIYLDALDLACYRIDPLVTPDFRKRLLMYYVSKSKKNAQWSKSLLDAMKHKRGFEGEGKSMSRRRFSMKVSQSMADQIEVVMADTKLNKTELIKSIVLQIVEDIITPDIPKHLDELQTLASVASC
jgi:hypothetical protein